MRPDARSPASVYPRVALVHDWLTHPGGSEKVVLELLRVLPDAELYTSVHDPEVWAGPLEGRKVHTSFLDRLPGARVHYPKLLPLMNAAFESFDLGGYDLVVSSSHSCAKNVLTGPDTLHVCYCHTPMRHAWEPRFLEGEGLGPFGLATARLLMGRLRRQDAIGALRPDAFVANSTHVAARIAKYYRRDAQVIHPPVVVDDLLTRPRSPDDYYLVLGRAVAYKRVDLAVAACAMLGRRVKIAGTGRGLEAARAAAGPGAEFLGHVSDEQLAELLSGARALLFPGEEDFGIVPVEAQAAGVPVVAYGNGGVRDSVIDGVTGVLFEEQDVEGVCEGIRRFESIELEDSDLRENARRFRPEAFREAFGRLVADAADRVSLGQSTD
jgi:glycosyltransferase involved in cell wall biosynthesis